MLSKKQYKNVFFVRHGETEWNLKGIIQGHKDPSLNSFGRMQADKASDYFIKMLEDNFNLIASDLKRAEETALFFSEKSDNKLLLEPGIKEIYLGKWEGLTPSEINLRFDNGYNKWLQDPLSQIIENAETIGEFSKRVMSAWQRILSKLNSKNTVIVTHGGVITALLAHFLNSQFDKLILDLAIDNCSFSHVRLFADNKIRVMSINSKIYLDDLSKEKLTAVDADREKAL